MRQSEHCAPPFVVFTRPNLPMKPAQITIAIVAAITILAHAHAQLSPLPLGAKPLSEQVQVLPFVLEFQTVKFKPHEHDVPEELRVSFPGQQIEIAGTKKKDVKGIKGKLCGHFGQLALFKSAEPQAGTLEVKIPSIFETTYYGISLDCTSGILLSKTIELAPGYRYDWSAKQDGTDFAVEITNSAGKVDSIRADTSTVKGFGFFATVRYPMSKADIIVTVNPPDPKK
jgi:hypothetical protein